MKLIGFFLGLSFLLAACSQPSQAAAPPKWVIGSGIGVQGTLVGWTESAAAGSPGDDIFFGEMYNASGDFHDTVGQGTVDASGNFGFYADCTAGKAACSVELSVEQTLCGGLSVSDKALKLTEIELIPVDAKYSDTQARPGGVVLISTSKPSSMFEVFNWDTYSYIHADRNSRVKGSCSDPDAGVISYELDLYKGWNTVRQYQHTIKTAVIPPEALWYFINPIIVGE